MQHMRTLLARSRHQPGSLGGLAQLRSQQQERVRLFRTMQALKGHIPGFLDRVAEVNNGLNDLSEQRLVPFTVEGQRLGYLKQEFAKQLLAYDSVFQQGPPPLQHQQQSVTLNTRLTTMEQRSAAVAGVLNALRAQGMFRGWRDELYPVSTAFHHEPALLLERAAAPFFGVRAYGIHINGYVEKPNGEKLLWVARRSKNKPTWPGMLDHIVAGGQPYGLSCAENVVKECWEEAGVPKELAAAAVPVSFISYVSMSEEGLKPDVLFCYDLKLPEDFVPTPQDGEVEEFMLWDLDRVAKVISSSQDYKPNCALVVIDFLIRHGLVAPEEPGYLQLVSKLRVGEPC